MMVLLISTRKSVGKEKAELVLKDDSIFINAQYIGILSGVSGLVLISVFAYLYSTLYPLPIWAAKAGILITSLIAVIPYILIVFYWLIIKLREKTGEWYDEKQFQDITRASLVTLVSSIIVMTAIFLVQYYVTGSDFIVLTWFPFYIFLVLLLFSSSTLYFSKRTGD
jgi:hypothetical protein